MAARSRSEHVLAGRIGGHVVLSWYDSRKVTAPARAAFHERFEREVDPDGTLAPTERSRRADMARRAYETRLALLSVKARRRLRPLARESQRTGAPR